MSTLHAAGATDTGKLRSVNEDAYVIGESVYAVADGMGGHLAGEVASATALETVKALDGKVFADSTTAIDALVEAARSANTTVARKAADEPSYRGMGTTLTAALVEGRRLHLAHVGDSRAYLLRDGDFRQLTDDHTLVQHLIDEGQITPEEAATHPQRSIITRAIGVSLDVEVDTMSLDLEDGDQVLICSDGLTGVVSDVEIGRCVGNGTDLDDTVHRLVEMANDQGGPDNITVVLLRYGEPPVTSAPAAGDTGELEGPEGRRVIVRTGESEERGDWAQRLGRFGALGTERAGRFEDGAPSGPSRWQRVGAVIIGLVVLVGLVVGGGWWLLSRSYYVGLDDEQVVIYQGVPAELGPISLSWVFERTDLFADDLPAFRVDAFREGRTAADLADARRIVANAHEAASGSDDVSPSPAPAETTTTP